VSGPAKDFASILRTPDLYNRIGMKNFEKLIETYRARMKSQDLPEVVIRNFEYYLRLLVEGETGYLREEDLDSVDRLPDADQLGEDESEAGREAFSRTVMIKLNGGLGTSMGLDRAKSLLEVKNGLTFLDIIARQALQSEVPLILMNSFATREESLELLRRRYPGLAGDIPLDFVQHKIPKVRQSDLTPARFPENPSLEWCPPGHGDIYTALVTSGLLEILLERGYSTVFVSNSDNLGAFPDPRILGFFTTGGYDFMMEVADRTSADRKGGHLARLQDRNTLVLRESAQCPAEDQKHFQDIKKHRYFNTNNLWIDLPALRAILRETGGLLKLPLIRNLKPVNPADPSSEPVYQLETAMGAAISIFRRVQAIRVPRKRFIPVKTTDDLLVVTSDATVLTDNWRIEPAPSRKETLPVVSLDPSCYRLIADLEKGFPQGPPSLIECDHFQVKGRFRIGTGVKIRGRTEIVNRSGKTIFIPDGSTLKGKLIFPG